MLFFLINYYCRYCPAAHNPRRFCKFDSNPIVGTNADGRLEIFVRLEGNMDLWQMYMSDPYDAASCISIYFYLLYFKGFIHVKPIVLT